MNLFDKVPSASKTAYVAPTAEVTHRDEVALLKTITNASNDNHNFSRMIGLITYIFCIDKGDWRCEYRRRCLRLA